MNLYEKIRNTECEIPEAFDLTSLQADDLIQNADPQDRYDLAHIAFKFGYIQRKRAEQTCRTNEAAAGEAEKLREYITDMTSRIRSEKRLRVIYTVAHRAFINDRLEVLNERQD